MVRERCHLYRPVGNVERAEIRIGEFVFKHQAPMPVEPNIHASERLDPRAVRRGGAVLGKRQFQDVSRSLRAYQSVR